MPRTTKREIVSCLSEMLREQRLDDITVKDLTERCGLSRQAFYYHFSDIYEALDWGIQQEFEALSARVSKELLEEPEQVVWEKFLAQAEERMLENRAVVLNTYRSIERSYVSHRLMNAARPIMRQEVRRSAGRYTVTEEQVEFIADLMTMCIVNIFLNWLDMGMPNRNMEHLDDFRAAVSGSADDMLRRLEQKNLNQ